MIPPGNLYLWWQKVPVRALSRSDWIAWEVRVGSALGQDARPLEDGTGIEKPFFAGESLADLLAGPTPDEGAILAVRQAARALHKFHQQIVTAHDSDEWPLSHGDATCRNVIVDLASGEASWLDFDIQHCAGVATSLRHADDLRALLVSAVAARDADWIPDVIQEAADKHVWEQLCRQIAGEFLPSTFALAQGPMNAASYWRLRTRLLQSLASR